MPKRKRSRKEQKAIHAKRKNGKSYRDVDRRLASGKSPVGGKGIFGDSGDSHKKGREVLKNEKGFFV